MYSASFDYKAQYQNDLTLNKGESLLHVKEQKNGWILVSNKNGELGIAHKTYLTQIKECDLTVKRELIQVALNTLNSDSSSTMPERDRHKKFLESELSSLPDTSSPSPVLVVVEKSVANGNEKSDCHKKESMNEARLSLGILDCLREETGATYDSCVQSISRILRLVEQYEERNSVKNGVNEPSTKPADNMKRLLYNTVSTLSKLQNEQWSMEERIVLYQNSVDWHVLLDASGFINEWYNSLHERSWHLHQSTLETRLHLELLLVSLTSSTQNLIDTWLQFNRYNLLHQLASIYQAETQNLICRGLLRVLLSLSMLPSGSVRETVCHEFMMSVLPGTMLPNLTGKLHISEQDPIVLILILQFLTHLMVVGKEIQPVLGETLTSSTIEEILRLPDNVVELFNTTESSSVSDAIRRISLNSADQLTRSKELCVSPGIEFMELVSCDVCPSSLLRHRAPLYHQLWSVDAHEEEHESIRDAVLHFVLAYNTYLPAGRNAVTDALLRDMSLGGAFCNQVQLAYCRSKILPKLLWKLLRDLHSDYDLPEVIYSTDREVMVGLVTRCIEDYGPTSEELPQLIQILEGVVKYTNFMNVGGRKKEEILPTLKGLLSQHGDEMHLEDVQRVENLIQQLS